MRIGSRDRLWLIGGLVVALLLVGVAWMFFISGQNDTTSSVRGQASSAQDEQVRAQHALNVLRGDSVNLAKYQAELAAAQQALPGDPGIAAFLRELHTAGDLTGVSISSVLVTPPTLVAPRAGAAAAAAPTASSSSSSAAASAGQPAASSSSTYQMQLTVVGLGPTDALTAFIKQLQQVQPRAVLLTNVAESPGQSAGRTQLTLTLEAFIAPADGATPSISGAAAVTN